MLEERKALLHLNQQQKNSSINVPGYKPADHHDGECKSETSLQIPFDYTSSCDYVGFDSLLCCWFCLFLQNLKDKIAIKLFFGSNKAEKVQWRGKCNMKVLAELIHWGMKYDW